MSFLIPWIDYGNELRWVGIRGIDVRFRGVVADAAMRTALQVGPEWPQDGYRRRRRWAARDGCLTRACAIV